MQGKRLNDGTPGEWDEAAKAAGWEDGFEDFSDKVDAILIKNRLLYGKEKSDGSSANYYKLPNDANELQDLISAKNMNAQIGEIFRECYRYGQASHSDELRGIKKILFYANAELARIEKYVKK